MRDRLVDYDTYKKAFYQHKAPYSKVRLRNAINRGAVPGRVMDNAPFVYESWLFKSMANPYPRNTQAKPNPGCGNDNIGNVERVTLFGYDI